MDLFHVRVREREELAPPEDTALVAAQLATLCSSKLEAEVDNAKKLSNFAPKFIRMGTFRCAYYIVAFALSVLFLYLKCTFTILFFALQGPRAKQQLAVVICPGTKPLTS